MSSRAHCDSGVCGGDLVIVVGSPTLLSRSQADPEVRAQDAQGIEELIVVQSYVFLYLFRDFCNYLSSNTIFSSLTCIIDCTARFVSVVQFK